MRRGKGRLCSFVLLLGIEKNIIRPRLNLDSRIYMMSTWDNEDGSLLISSATLCAFLNSNRIGSESQHIDMLGLMLMLLLFTESRVTQSYSCGSLSWKVLQPPTFVVIVRSPYIAPLVHCLVYLIT